MSIASAGVDDAEVSLLGGYLGIAAFVDNQLQPSIEKVNERLAIRLGRGGRWVRYVTSDLTTEGISFAAKEARSALAGETSGVEGEGLPAPQSYSAVDAYDELTAQLGPLDRAAVAARALTSALRLSGSPGVGEISASGRFWVARGGLSSEGRPRIYALANTRGLLAYHPSTRVIFEVRIEAGGRLGRSFAVGPNLESIDVTGGIESALEQALEGGPAAVLPPGRYPAVLDRPAAARLFQVLGRTAGVAAKARGESFLVQEGKAVFDSRFTIVDDFSHALHRGEPFDCDGVARSVVSLVEGGVVGSPVVAWSSRGEHAPTGHGVVLPSGRRSERAEHLVVSGGQGHREHLARGVRAGVLVTDFADVEIIDPASLRVTGVTGPGFFAIEGGEQTRPLMPLRFELSLFDLLREVSQLGSPGWAEGAVVPPMTVTELPLYAPA